MAKAMRTLRIPSKSIGIEAQLTRKRILLIGDRCDDLEDALLPNSWNCQLGSGNVARMNAQRWMRPFDEVENERLILLVCRHKLSNVDESFVYVEVLFFPSSRGCAFTVCMREFYKREPFRSNSHPFDRVLWEVFVETARVSTSCQLQADTKRMPS